MRAVFMVSSPHYPWPNRTSYRHLEDRGRACDSERHFIIELMVVRPRLRWRSPVFVSGSAAVSRCGVAALRPVQHDNWKIEALQDDLGGTLSPRKIDRSLCARPACVGYAAIASKRIR